MHAVFGDMLGVGEVFDGGQTDEAEGEEGEGVSEGAKHAVERLGGVGGTGFQGSASGDEPGAEDEGTDAEVHERCAPGFDFGEAAREDAEVDGEDGGAGYDEHAAAVEGEEGADWEGGGGVGLGWSDERGCGGG